MRANPMAGRTSARREPLSPDLPSTLLLALLAAACAPGEPTSGADDVDGWIAEVEARLVPAIVIEGEELPGWTLAGRMESHHVPGVSVAVIENGEIAWTRTWGVADRETGTPVTTGTLFQAASISKPVAALAALSLVEDAELGLDAPVNEALTTWRVPDNEFTADSAVTLRGLLTHSAGLTVWGFPGYRKDEPFVDGEPLATNAQVLDGEGNTDPVRVYKVPGTSWQYSGGGYTVMEQMLEDVTGRAFPEVVAERVLGPAGMTRSTYEQPLPETRWAEAARGHRPDGSEVEGEWHTYPEQAAAGLWTTPEDLARLSVHLLGIRAGEIRDGVISREMLDRMLTPNRNGAEDFRNWGLGFGLELRDGMLELGHGGANEGFRAAWKLIPDLGIGYVIMTNGDLGGPLASEIARAIAGARGWPINQPETRTRMRPQAAEIEPLLGEYDVEGPDLVVEVRAGEDATLELTVTGQGTFTYYASSPDEWFDPSDGEVVTFERDAEGDVIAASNGRTRIVKRAPDP